MPTHIFVRLGIWPDVISWNIRSAKAALNYPANGAISHHYPHALDYLIYAHLQIGGNDKAQQVVQAIKAGDNYQETFVSGYALAAIPARYLLERKQWSEAATLDTRTPSTFPWEKFPEVEAITYFARGLGAARSGDAIAASEAIKTLDDLYQRTVNTGQPYWAVLVDSQRKTVAAWLAYLQGSNDQALELMRQAADLEESVDKHPVTPGAVLPARELLGDLLVLLNRPAEAKVAYEKSLQIAPNRLNSFYDAELAD
jgi:tetratricopeptide (TPR) repeat protein